MRFQPRNRPLSFVRRPLALWLCRDPQFKILDAVVALYSVFVVNVLEAFQRAAKVLRHYLAVLKHGFPLYGFDDVPGLGVRVPSVSGLIKILHGGAAFVLALDRTALYISVRLGKKCLAAFDAVFADGRSDFSAVPLAVMAAVASVRNVCCLYLERLVAVLTVDDDAGFTENTGLSSKDSDRHFDRSLAGAVIMPKLFVCFN